jgi:hypothetical protein
MRDDDKETLIRQRQLAQWIGTEFYQSNKLKPLGRHSSFGVVPPLLDLWFDGRLCDLAWWAVGRQIEAANERFSHVIDHAWLAGYCDTQHEPWALVTEPYLRTDLAQPLVARAQKAMTGWDVRARCLPPAQSSWNPGSCCPIVVTFEAGCIRSFLRASLSWAMKELQ